MARSLGLKVIRKPRNAILQYKAARDIVRAKLQPVADAHARSRQAITANWTNQPQFEGKTGVGPKTIYVLVVITNKDQQLTSGGATIGQLWYWLDVTGTKAHRIPLNGRSLLAFEWGGPGSYLSKTGPGPARFGGPGTVQGGTMRFFRYVNHPGFPPRHFSEAINKDLKEKFDNAVGSGYRAALKATKE
ncbi:MAG: hypothetical protein KJ077_10440 [Anaerolineae bacterium]|nr:hypothetical protein [Anaerolineae bacterium]